MTGPQAIHEFERQLQEAAEKQLELLLETKHLYQKVTITPEEITQKLQAEIGLETERAWFREVSAASFDNRKFY